MDHNEYVGKFQGMTGEQLVMALLQEPGLEELAESILHLMKVKNLPTGVTLTAMFAASSHAFALLPDSKLKDGMRKAYKVMLDIPYGG